MTLFTLIHICRNETSLHNNSFVKSFEDQINLYFCCAKQLHQSLESTGIKLVVVTNDKGVLEKLNNNNYKIDILQMDFDLKVPSGIKFYSAHYKLELFNYLSTLNEDYVGIVDCDVVCINDMPDSFKNIIGYKVPLYYDITDQVMPAYGSERIISDKEKLSNRKSIGLWAGGEFIAGPPQFFKQVYDEVESIKDSYFSNYDSFQHQGDEMLTSVAIENLMLNSNVRILDAGSLSIITRFWSPKTLHVQKSIEAYNEHFLLHLPSDKKFIASLKKDELKGEKFFKNYKQHLFKSRILENTFKGVKPYVKKMRNKLTF